jgi:hypothetical protein
MFTKGIKDETIVVTYDPVLNSLGLYDLAQHDRIRNSVKNAIMKECSDLKADELKKCVAKTYTGHVQKAHASKSLLRKYQHSVSNQLRNYTCADLSLETATPISTYDFQYEGKSYTVNNLLDLAHAKVWYVNNFITPEECQIFEKHGNKSLVLSFSCFLFEFISQI